MKENKQTARIEVRTTEALKENFDGYIKDCQVTDPRYSKSRFIVDAITKALKKVGRL
jgi:hypothetical protein